MHYFKRFYLIFSLVFAFTIPLITFTYQTDVILEPEPIEQPVVMPMIMQDEPLEIKAPPINYLAIVWISLYGIGVLVFGFRFIKNIRTLVYKIKDNEQYKEPSHTNVLLGDSVVPHTFLSYIFVPKRAFKQQEIPQEILLHEKAHVVQKHSWDILFIEFVQVIFWFNPLLIWTKKSIKLNHEFLADQTVITQRFSLQRYLDLLINYPDGPNQTVLSSPINYSLTKKRLQMMTTNFSRKRVVLKLLALIPVLIIGVLFFNNEIVAKENFIEITPEKMENPIQKTSPIKVLKEEPMQISTSATDFPDAKKGVTKAMMTTYDVWIKKFRKRQRTEKGFTLSADEVEKIRAIYNAMTPVQKESTENFPKELVPTPTTFQEIATKAMVKEYNSWAKDMNAKIKNDQQITLRKKELDRMEYIYSMMSQEQRNNAQKFPDIDMPPPPPAPEAPKPILDVPEPPVEPVPAPSPDNEIDEEIKIETEAEIEVMEAMEEAEVQREEAEIEALEAMEAAEVAALEAIERSETSRGEARIAAMEAIKRSEASREAAMMSAMKAVEQAQQVRMRAEEQAQVAVARAMEQAELAKRKASKAANRSTKNRRKYREEAIKASEKAREAAGEARKEAMKSQQEARKIQMEARKEAMKAQQKARKDAMKARKEVLRYKPVSPTEFVEKMDTKGAEFYYKGERISSEEAHKLMNDANGNLSISSKTKNGKTVVKIKK